MAAQVLEKYAKERYECWFARGTQFRELWGLARGCRGDLAKHRFFVFPEQTDIRQGSRLGQACNDGGAGIFIRGEGTYQGVRLPVPQGHRSSVGGF